MKKETINVPKNMCPLDTIAELGRRTRNAWIFLHRNVIDKFEQDSQNNETIELDMDTISFKWEATDKYPATIICIDNSNLLSFVWYPVIYINASDIAFETISDDPNEVFFIRMED